LWSRHPPRGGVLYIYISISIHTISLYTTYILLTQCTKYVFYMINHPVALFSPVPHQSTSTSARTLHRQRGFNRPSMPLPPAPASSLFFFCCPSMPPVVFRKFLHFLCPPPQFLSTPGRLFDFFLVMILRGGGASYFQPTEPSLSPVEPPIQEWVHPGWSRMGAILDPHSLPLPLTPDPGGWVGVGAG